MQGIYIRCIARYKLIYTQATARWKFGDTYSETCCYVARSKIFSWAGKIIWVIGFSSQMLWKEGCQRQLLFTISFIQQAFQWLSAGRPRWPLYTDYGLYLDLTETP